MSRACQPWPLERSYKVLSGDGLTDGSPAQLVWVGPPGPNNTNVQWLIFNLIVSYDGPLVPGSSMVVSYQYNSTTEERQQRNRVTLALQLTGTVNVLPVIGAAR